MGRSLSAPEAVEIATVEWPEGEFADHPHYVIYRTAMLRTVESFATVYQPAGDSIVTLDPEIVISGNEDNAIVRLDLVGHWRDGAGRVEAISYRPESLQKKTKGGAINWSDLSEKKRAAFVLLEHATPGTTPHVFSGEDGQLFGYRWKATKTEASLSEAAARLLEQRDRLARGEFAAKPTAYTCDRCPARISCPLWMERPG